MAKLRIIQDEYLLLALKNGDYRAFETVYNKYRAVLLSKFRKGFQSEELVQDSLQELFLKVWKSRRSIDPCQSFLAYLYKIAEHIIADFYRRVEREKRAQLEISAASSEHYSYIEENLVTKEKSHLVNQIISKLPVKQQNVFKMFKLEGKSYKEISGQLGISMSTINKHLYAANGYVKRQVLSKSEIFMTCLLTIILPDYI